MSNVLWINADADTSVGTATITSADELFTITTHGLVDGDRIVVSNLTGGAGSSLAENGVYWVRDATTDTFAVALTRGGKQILFAADGGADVDRFQPVYSAPELRQLFSAFLAHGSPSGFHNRLGAREGVLPSANTTSSHVQFPSVSTWTVRDMTAVVYPAISSLDGPYVVAVQEDTGSIDSPDGTNDRIDRLDLQIQDHDEDASGFRRVRIVYTAGSPSASPVAPVAPANSMPLSTFRVLAAGAGITNATQPQMTVSRGGILPVRDDTEQPTANRYDGYFLWRQDRKTLDVYDETANGMVPIARTGGWEVIVDTTLSGSGTVAIDDVFPAGTFDMIRVEVVGGLDQDGEDIWIRVNGDSTTDLHERAFTVWKQTDGTVFRSFANNSTTWRLAEWNSTAFNTATAYIYRTDADNFLTFRGEGYRGSSATSLRHYSISNGRLGGSRLLDSIQFGATNTATISSGTQLVIEGRRKASFA